MTVPAGPYVLWLDRAVAGWSPISGNSVEELLTYLDGSPWCVTGAPLKIGVIKVRTEKSPEPKKKG